MSCLTPTLHGLLTEAAARWPQKAMVSTPDGDRTFSQIESSARALAGKLVGLGVRPADHVAVLIPNSVDAIVAVCGIAMIGGIAVPLNTRYRSDELSFAIAHADAVGIITTSWNGHNSQGESVDFINRLEEALPDLGKIMSPDEINLVDANRLRFVVSFGTQTRPWVDEFEVAGKDSKAEKPFPIFEPTNGSNTALILYTSGTTARPKGCLISHSAVVKTCSQGALSKLELVHDDKIWNPAPLCHISAYVSLVGSLVTGATYLTAPHFDPDDAADHLAREGVTVAFANFPAFYFSLADSLDRANLDLENLRLLTTAASPPEIARIRANFAQATQLSVSGATELSGSICINSISDSPMVRSETCGNPLDGISLSIRDPDNGSVLPAGKIGELWVSGFCLFDGYYNDDGQPFRSEGFIKWFPTGDLASLDEEGRYAYRGRLKDMLKVGGENVAAAEVEAFLMTHDLIAVAQVVAMPDDRLGEVPVAFVEKAAASDISEWDVIDYCKGKIAGYKIPRIVRFVDNWPRSVTKIQKGELRRILEREVIDRQA